MYFEEKTGAHTCILLNDYMLMLCMYNVVTFSMANSTEGYIHVHALAVCWFYCWMLGWFALPLSGVFW